mgnify:CR=1 FL=1
MTHIQYQLNEFREFALARINSAKESLTLDELYDEWRLRYPDPDQLANDAKAVAASLTDYRNGVEGKPAYCVECVIRTCEELAGPGLTFCHACSRLPCRRLKDLDRRYRTRYGVSLMDNQARIRSIGARAFLVEDRARWTCTACGAHLCMHSPACPQCGIERVMPATGVQAPGIQSRRSARQRRGSSGRR